MNLTDDSATKELKIGTRVPVQPEEGKFQYIDLGELPFPPSCIWNNNSLTLDVRFVEVSSLASADQAPRGQPLVRQMVLSGRTLVVPDKPMVIGSVDDPNSRREFQTGSHRNQDQMRAPCYFLGSLRNGCSKLK